jgi:predicted O-linked N-acetylglucosamine transferase (SPINDLY family)
MTLEQQLESGLSHHRAGRLAEAEKMYRQVLAQQPNHPDALHLLGLVAVESRRWDAAVDWLRRAVRIQPDNAEAHNDLGNALRDQRQLDESIAAYRQAIGLKPDFAEAHCNLGNALRAKGRLEEAITACGQAVRLKPDNAEAHYNLGIALQANGAFDQAIAAYQQAIRLRPDFAQAHNNLGNVFAATGQLDQAIASQRQAIGLKADYAEAHYNLAVALQRKEQLDEALAAYRQAIRLKPDHAEAHNNLGNVLRDKGRLEDAIAAYRRAVELKPDLAHAHNNLGNAAKDLGRLEEAVNFYRQAIRIAPDYGNAHNNLGNALKDLGQLDEAIACYRRAIGLMPDHAEAHGALVFTLQYHPACDAKMIHEEARRWNQRHAEPLAHFIQPHANNRDPDRRLRIGYVSADFRRHSVGYFLLPLLEHHDRQFGDLFCYCNRQLLDDFTQRMKRACPNWRNILNLSDQDAANRIRSDAIDILVDLSGHTAGNRLLLFALKPAPIQVTYLGYPNTTGMTAMDYRLTDALADPPGLTDELNVEKLWRLPGCAWCYAAPPDPPQVAARSPGPITFGCFNAFAKINEPLVAIWAKLLERVAGSRLLLKSAGAGAASAQRRLAEQFAKHGISGERIEMRGQIADSRQHLNFYGRVDVALDSYPYNGTTTTCEALWMGVPVVSLAGRSHACRVGASLLGSVGLPELVAQTPEQYVQIAADLAGDLPRLAELRRTLRGQMEKSPLMDAARFARNVEAAYRQMWRNWCTHGENPKPPIFSG